MEIESVAGGFDFDVPSLIGKDECFAASWSTSGGASGWHIYCDLDGVLADFDAGVEALLHKRPHESETSSEMWSEISPIDVQFLSTLQWTSDGRDLWRFLSSEAVAGRCSVSLLTGIPRGNWAVPQKVRWCRERLGDWFWVNLCRADEKYMYARPGAVLIDDSQDRYKDAWEDGGGNFVHHESGRSLQTIRSLETILATPPSADRVSPYGALPAGAVPASWHESGWWTASASWRDGCSSWQSR